MATATILKAPGRKVQALTTAYLGASAKYIITGAKRVSVSLDDAAIGFTVQFYPIDGYGEDSTEDIVAAGGMWWEDIDPGQTWSLDIKAASGTPNAQIRVM